MKSAQFTDPADNGGIHPNHGAISATPLLACITFDPDICHGKPCVRGLGYPVEAILKCLSGGNNVGNLLAEFLDLERDDLLGFFEYARKALTARSQHLMLT